MQKGFTQHHEKGLFTFYREQEQKPKHTLIRNSKLPINTSKKSRINKKILSTSLNESTGREIVNLTQNQAKRRRINRYQNSIEEQFDHNKHFSNVMTEASPENTKNIISMNFNFNSPRKNAQYYQLIICKHKRVKTECDNHPANHHSALRPLKVISELSVRQLSANDVHQLFQPKRKYLNSLNNAKKIPLKMSPITGRCISQLKEKPQVKNRKEQDIKKQVNQTSINFVTQKIERLNDRILSNVHQKQQQKQFYMPLLHSAIKKRKKAEYSSSIHDGSDSRKRRLQENHFWRELHKKDDKLHKYIDINKKIQEWLTRDSANELQNVIINDKIIQSSIEPNMLKNRKDIVITEFQ